MRRPESGQVILGGCVHHGSDFQPESELVCGLHQRPHPVPRPVTESTERSLKPAGPSLQPRQCQSGKATSRVGFRIKSRTLQRADLVIKPLPGFPRRRPARRAPGYPPAAMADTEEHGSATASVRGDFFLFPERAVVAAPDGETAPWAAPDPPHAPSGQHATFGMDTVTPNAGQSGS